MKGACPGDESVLAFVEANVETEELARIQEHLDGCDDCRQMVALLGRAVYEEGSGARTAPPARAIPAVGARIDRYVLTDLLGKGAMALVFAAYDPQLHRTVALKVLRPDARDPSREQRLVREAQAMAQIAHPNVIRIYYAGTAEGRPFIAMERVEGTTLAGWLRERDRSWHEIALAFLGAGSGLAAAHAAGIVHRDFKPANVLMSTKGDVLVTDFGLARTSGVSPDTPSDEVPQVITATGMVLGTPSYMAPEQFSGPADARSDQFAFSVALYEALYRVHPFARALRSGAPSLLGTVDPLPPSLEVPEELFAIVSRGMSRQPETRYPSMAAVLAELGAALAPRDPARVPTPLPDTMPMPAARPMTVPPPMAPPDGVPLARSRGRMLAAAGAGLLLALLVFVAVRVLPSGPARAESVAPVAPAAVPAVPAPEPAPPGEPPPEAPAFAATAVVPVAAAPAPAEEPQPAEEPAAEPAPEEEARALPAPRVGRRTEPHARRSTRARNDAPPAATSERAPSRAKPAEAPDGIFRSVYSN